MQVGDVGPMTSFSNETLGDTWDVKGDSSDEHTLQARAEDYRLGIVPKGALLLTAGVDVHATGGKSVCGAGSVAWKVGWWPATSSTAPRQ